MSSPLPRCSAEFFYLASERAYLLHSIGLFEEALALFEGLLEIDPNNRYCHDAISATYLAMGMPEEAIRHAGFVLASKPSAAAALVRRCEAFLMLEMLNEAERDLQILQSLPATLQTKRIALRLETVKRSQMKFLSSPHLPSFETTPC